jgi:predicted nucleotidyltransferase
MQTQFTRQEAIGEITRRLVDYFHPQRIYLFGSAARGDDGPDSDLDFAVVLPDDAPDGLYRAGIHLALWDVGTAADVAPWPASDFDARAAHVKASLPLAIMREGKLLYDARSTAA